MADSDRVIFWDFDGTLGYRPGGWAKVMAAVLAEHTPGYVLTAEDIRPCTSTGFPWHSPDVSHPELGDPERWWQHIAGVVAHYYESAGVAQSVAQEMAGLVCARFPDPAAFVLYDDTLPALETLAALGWRHRIISNHVPELSVFLSALGVLPLVEHVTNSASIGYEKPHPEVYRFALEAAGQPHGAWMIGDNIVADVLGGEKAGLQTILVRRHDARARRYCADLREVVSLLTVEV